MGDIYTNPPQSRNEAILRATIDGTEYTDPPQSRIEDLLIELKQTIESGSVSSYNDLTDKPSINDVTLSGNKTSDDLHILQGDVPYLLSDVSDVSIVADGTTITIAWTDPSDIMDGSTVVTAWAGTKVVRKQGSAPENVFDGTVVVDSKVRNQYSVNGYEDTGLEVGTYYYRFFPYSENGVYTRGQYGNATATTPIYGAEWDGSSSPAWSRTDAAANFADPNPYYASMTDTPSSPFDNISPWKDMEIVEDAEAGTLVKIPKFFYKWTRNGDAMKLQISMDQKEGFSCSPAHMDRGDGQGERDIVYVSRYSPTSSYKSVTSAVVLGYKTRDEFRNGIHSLGSDIWQWDYAMFETIRMLYLVEYAHWNMKQKIGKTTTSTPASTGVTNNMGYHTGTSASDKDTDGTTQYRNIEFEANSAFIDGIYGDDASPNEIKIIKNPSYFSDSVGGNPVLTRTESVSYGCCSKFANISGYDWVLIPENSVTDSTYSTYTCNGFYIGRTGVVLSNGFTRPYFSLSNGASNKSTGTFTRIMKLPNNS